MRHLLIVAHGSRREASNNEVRRLAARIAGMPEAAEFATVQAAFLELAEPSIPDGIQRCIDAGATQVTVFPYFLSAGRHVVSDIPAEVAVKQQAYPHLDIRIAPWLGSAEAVAGLILQTAQPPENTPS